MSNSCNGKRALVLLAVFALVACQPTPEERFDRAQSYMQAHEYSAAIIELKNYLRTTPGDARSRRMLAEASVITGDIATAEAEYRKIYNLIDIDDSLRVAHGRTLIGVGNAQLALDDVVPELETTESDPDTAAFVGSVYAVLGELDAAEIHFEKALALDSDHGDALIGLAFVASAKGNDRLAEQLLLQARRRHPDEVSVLRAHADYLRHQLRFVEAAEVYDAAMAAEGPETPIMDQFMVRQSQISTLIAADMLDRATEQLERFSQLAPGHPLLNLFRGHIAFGEGRYDDAKRALLSYLSQVQDDANAAAILGTINFSEENFGQAEQYLSSAVRADVGGDRVRVLLAETQLRLDKPEAAIVALEDAQLGSESDAMVLAVRGRAKFVEGDDESAIEYFEESLRLDNGSSNVNLALAASYLRNARFSDAEQVLLELPSGSNGDYRRDMLLMTVYQEQGRVDAAIDLASSIVAGHADDAEAQALVGVLYLNLGQDERATSHLSRAVEIDPTNAGAIYSLGILAMRGGDDARGIELFENILALRPTYVPAIVQLAIAHLRQGSLERIDPVLANALAAEPDSGVLRKLSARIRIMQGRIDDANEELEEARHLFPTDAGVMQLTALLALREGRPEEAVLELESAVRSMPENAVLWLDLARANLLTGDAIEALDAIRTFRRLQPHDVRGLAIEVNSRLRIGDSARARGAVERFADRYPDEDYVEVLLGDIELADGNAEQALTRYEGYSPVIGDRAFLMRHVRAHQLQGGDGALGLLAEWLESYPDDVEVRRSYAQLLQASGRVDQAIAQYEILERAGQLNATDLNNLAWYYHLDNRPEALTLARRAHELDPDNGSVTDTYGWILYGQGETARALELLQTASSQSPDNTEIRVHLATALAAAGREREARTILTELFESGLSFAGEEAAREVLRTL